MEPIVVLVGFLGAGKTTLLKQLVSEYLAAGWKPAVILNDYENADLDAERFLEFLPATAIQALSGSCVCCSGAGELREQVNAIPVRDKGITLIEANGTTDAVALMEFLGIGLQKRFLPPVQISVVDCKNWQKRDEYNALEAHQVQVSSMIYLNHLEGVDNAQLEQVKASVRRLNPTAVFRSGDNLQLLEWFPSHAAARPTQEISHLATHWSSCSAKLPDPMPSKCLQAILEGLPTGILRVKGCTRLDEDAYYSYFEKTATDRDARVQPYKGTLISGPMILLVGPASSPEMLDSLIAREVAAHVSRKGSQMLSQSP